MHSSRKKKQRLEQDQEKPDPSWPTHSQMGNPYPPGLEPHIIKYEPPDKPNCSPQPLDEAKIPGPGKGLIVTDEYRYHKPDERLPRLKVRIAPRSPNQTDEQWEFCVQDTERFTLDFAKYLFVCQVLCTHLGNHVTCSEGACRRKGVCCGMRDEERYWLPILVFPPCVPLDLEIIETYRQEINRELTRCEAEARSAPLPVARPGKTA